MTLTDCDKSGTPVQRWQLFLCVASLHWTRQSLEELPLWETGFQSGVDVLCGPDQIEWFALLVDVKAVTMHLAISVKLDGHGRTWYRLNIQLTAMVLSTRAYAVDKGEECRAMPYSDASNEESRSRGAESFKQGDSGAQKRE